MTIPFGYCQCGCGNTTNIITKTNKREGRIKGQPSKFISGHNGRLIENVEMLRTMSGKGERGSNWRGGKIIDPSGYRLTFNPKYKKTSSNYVRDHIFKIENILGRTLPYHAVIHHIDGDTLNNKNCNLIVCENQAYHNLLHKRQRALVGGGDVHMLKCRVCKQYDYPTNMYVHTIGWGRHRECHRQYAASMNKKRAI